MTAPIKTPSPQPLAIFRTDASIAIGTGHVQRCVSLALALRTEGIESLFWMRELPGHLGDLVAMQGFALHWTSGEPGEELTWLRAQHPAWLVVDHYGIDAAWAGRMKPYAKKLLVIEDAPGAAQSFPADMVLNQNLGPHAAGGNALRLEGPAYALLRAEFSTLRPKAPSFFLHTPPAIGVSLGGSDPNNATELVLHALALLAPLQVSVLIGGQNPHRERLIELIASHASWEMMVDCKEVAKWLLRQDIIIGAGGTSSWERAAMGKPALVIMLAENQVALAKAAETAGILSVIGDASELQASDIAAALFGLLEQPKKAVLMAQKAWELVDGLGAARVAKAMKERLI